MNVFDYEPIVEMIDPNKTWVSIENKLLLSREIKYKTYWTLGRQSDENHYYNYFIIFLDDPPIDRGYGKTKVDAYGRVMVSLKHIWKQLGFDKFENNRRVYVELNEESDDMIVYKILK